MFVTTKQIKRIVFFFLEMNLCFIAKGIPMSIRPKAWLYLCGGKLLLDKYPNKYEDCLLQNGDPKCLEDIRKDLHRQFPLHEMFISEDKPG